MLKKPIVPFFSLLMTSTLLSTPVFADSIESAVDRSIACAMGLANHRNLYFEDIEMAAKTLHDTISHIEDADAILAIANVCTQYRPSKPRVQLGQDAAVAVLSKLSTNEKVTKLMRGFIEPQIQCSSIGWHLGASLFLGLGAGGEIAQCSDTYGRSWFESNIGGNVRAGADAVAGIYGRRDSRTYASFPLYLSSNAFLHTGLLASILWGGRKNFSTDVLGVGLGAGYAISKGTQINLQMTPSITSKKSLRRALLTGESLIRKQDG